MQLTPTLSDLLTVIAEEILLANPRTIFAQLVLYAGPGTVPEVIPVPLPRLTAAEREELGRRASLLARF